MINYSLKEIAQWQKEISGKETKIFLPSLQRGFVWKPNQIEALWDSIFRGYPIGAILMSVDVNENRNLLDGQQRCTSIALGHFNPFNDNTEAYFSLKSYKPSIWIDLAPKQTVNGQKFIFRCLTQSHPWGYQLRDSNTTLSMSDRRKALEHFMEKEEVKEQNIERYTDLKSNSINPWDTYYPIPLAYITEINDSEIKFEEFKNILTKKIENLKIKTKYSASEFVDYTQLSNDDFNSIYKGFQNYQKLQIPEIKVEANILKDDDETFNSESEDPTLFVRLNSAGTRISGEELIYSIYKAHFPQVKDLVEKIGASYIAPSKVISLFSRLSACEQNNFTQYQKEFTIQNFRKKIAEPDFKEILKRNIETEATIIIEQAIGILLNNDPSFPKILLKQIIVSNSDLFFVLLIYIKKYGFEKLNDKDKKEIAATYLYLLWFNKEPKKVANALFGFFSTEQDKVSWKMFLKNLISLNLVLPIVDPSLFRSNIVNILITHKVDSDHLSTIKENNLLSEKIVNVLHQTEEENSVLENWNLLVNRIYYNKSLLLYVQKDYLNQKFKEFNQFENIDDTNRPWDWDHIYPISWVYNNRGINPLVRSWVNSIGNFRALSYDDNRSESNNVSPKIRFEADNNKKESFISENDFLYWDQIDNGFWRVKDDEHQVTIFLSAVIHRMVNIYENWFNNYFKTE